MEIKSVAIIMTVHNRKRQTIECLRCLFHEPSLFDVYLTDDGCTDGTAEAIEEMFPDVQILKGNGELFWNRGMHLAFREALKKDYRFYLWLNDDTIVVPSFLNKLMDFSEKEGERSILCGACVNNEIEGIITYGGFSANHELLQLSNEPQLCSFASGNIFFIPRSVVQKLGNLDYYYRHSMGDFDYAVRASKNDVKIIQVPGYLGICDVHPRIPKWRDTNYGLKYRIKNMYSPLGQNPFEFFHCDKKNKGVIYASVRFFLLHLRCIFPKLWGRKYYTKI